MKSIRWRAIAKAYAKANKKQKNNIRLVSGIDLGFAALKKPRGGNGLGA